MLIVHVLFGGCDVRGRGKSLFYSITEKVTTKIALQNRFRRQLQS